MSVAREARESEKIMSLIWATMPHLLNCVWYPVREGAYEHIDEMLTSLIKLKDQLKKEEREEIGQAQSNMDRTFTQHGVFN